MKRTARIRRMALRGLCCAAVLFCADLAGAFLAIGSLFDPRVESFYLLAVAAASTLVVGSVAGALVGLLWPRRLQMRLSRRLGAALLVTLAGVVLGVGYGGRRARQPPVLGPRPAVTAARPTPVLWIVLDTARADAIYGEDYSYPNAPRLGAFAEDAWVFEDAETSSGWTIPSVAAMLTGIHPTRLRTRDVLPSWAPTAAERLRAAGYATYAVVDNALLENRNGFAEGFESFYQRSGLRFVFSLPGFRLLQAWPRRKLRELWPTYYHGAAGATDEALRLLDAADPPQQAPLFLYVHYMDPHYPYYAHGPDPANVESLSLPWATWRAQGRSLRPAQLAFLQHRYAGEIRYLDTHVGRLLDGWQRRYGDDSAVVVTSDHGEQFLDHGELGHGGNLHPELVRAPLFLKLPRAVVSGPRGRIAEPVSLVGILPTLLEGVGVAEDLAADGVAMDGRSWLGWLRGAEPAPTAPLVAKQLFKGRLMHRWRHADWAWIRTVDPQTGAESGALYDKVSDYAEMHDVSGKQDRLAAGLKNALQTHLQAAQNGKRGELINTARANHQTLRALGYIQ